MKKLLLTSAVLIATASGIAYSATRPISADSDLPLVVQHQQQQLDNHEARITNVEGDVKDLQSNTNTKPSSDKVTVPSVSPAPAATPEQPKVTITAWELVPEGNNERCNLTYSDGTSHTFFHTQWSDDGKAMATNGVCDDSLIGKEKQDTYTGY